MSEKRLPRIRFRSEFCSIFPAYSSGLGMVSTGWLPSRISGNFHSLVNLFLIYDKKRKMSELMINRFRGHIVVFKYSIIDEFDC